MSTLHHVARSLAGMFFGADALATAIVAMVLPPAIVATLSLSAPNANVVVVLFWRVGVLVDNVWLRQ